jgi:hypothetical protein
MELSKTHLESLGPHLRAHEERLEQLRAARDGVLRELERLRSNDGEQEPEEAPKPDPIGRLDYERELIDREIGVHEAILELGRDERLFAVLGELAADAKLAREAARDPRGFAREHGIELPQNLAVELDVGADDDVRLRLIYFDDLSPFVATWDRDGFKVPSATPP